MYQDKDGKYVWHPQDALEGRWLDDQKKLEAKMNPKPDARPDWNHYYMSIAQAIAKRPNCIRRQIGAVLVLDNRIISTGYNGTPRGLRNCFDGGCERCANVELGSGKDLGDCLCSHAEENTIVQAAYHGMTVKGSVLYTMLSPCLICAKMIINAGIGPVVYENEYPHNQVA